MDPGEIGDMNEVHDHGDRIPAALQQGPLVLHMEPGMRLTADQFFRLCQLNPELRLEQSAEGDIVVMPPAGGRGGARNTGLTTQVGAWAYADGTGIAFDSSTGFVLPNGAIRAPDVSWVRRTRLAALPPDQRERFLPLCPEFVIELLSPSDSLPMTRDKLLEYIANGARLGWLIDPMHRRVEIYRSGVAVEILDDPAELSADPILAGFVLRLARIWDPGF